MEAEQLASRKHASIIKNQNSFELHSHGPHGTAIMRNSTIINIPVGEHFTLEDGDGIKLCSLNDHYYRSFIFTWSIANKDLSPKEIKCAKCEEFFIFSPGEQIFYQRKGFHEPLYCESCRIIRKRQRPDQLDKLSAVAHNGPINLQDSSDIHKKRKRKKNKKEKST